MSTKTAWILYSFIRIGLFAASYLVVWLLGGRWWLAAVIATLVSFALSVLLLDGLRSKASAGFAQWRQRDRTEDDIVEDDMIDEDPSLLDNEPKPQEAPATDQAQKLEES